MIALPGVVIQSKIYESSASLVYRGIRVQDGQAIVVKMLKQDYPSPQELTRYRQEYQITCSLNVKGVVKAYEQRDYQHTLVILLEDFGGESLAKWMQANPSAYCPMPLSTFLQLALEITDILGRIHAANIIHKDINPSNIVLNLDSGVVKLIDFGIATQFSRTKPTSKSPYGLEGTLAYLSPEQTGRMNRLLDYRTDFYSLGVTFYELLTGQLPFPTTDILELVHCHLAKPPVPPHKLNSTIPKPISDIILKLMAKNAEDRYQNAWGIKADLECCAQQLAETGQIGSIQIGLQDVSDQFHISQKLYGRESEIAALLTAFAGVEERRSRSVDEYLSVHQPIHPLPHSKLMLVSGYAGIGKSALVQELYKLITAKRRYFVFGKFDQFQRNIPYIGIVNALRKLMQQLLGEPDEQVQQWQSQLLAALGNNGQLIIDVIPEVELIIGKQQPVPKVGAAEAQNRFHRVFQSFVRVFCSKEHPLVIFLDDLQWIDSATLKLIELILLDEQNQFLFLIGAYRDNEVAPTHPLVLTLEKLRQQGTVLQEIAIQGARDNEYLQEEALAYELAAKFYLERGRSKIAQAYIKEAYYCYERWGAVAKVKDLETRYSQFFPQLPSVASKPVRTTAGTTSNTSGIAFDLATVMKASQAISSEIEIEQLLHSLMQILIENAGAQTGCLILNNAGAWVIEAACELNDGEQVCTTRVLQSIPTVNRLPESIIQYVIRTHESVLLDDAAREGDFINDSYIQRNQTQSLFCLPLLNQSKLVGVLYLENQLATGAFTPEQSQVLHLLSTQAAIAIENAKLYAKLRASESRMAQFLEAIPVGIAVVDAAGRPYYFNQQATQLLGKGAVPSATLDQLTETYQAYIAGTDQKYPTEKLNLFRALRGECTRTDDLEIHRGDAIIPVEVLGTPVFDEQGNVAYAIATFQDITERRQAEELLANYNRTLEQQVAERTVALQQSEAALRDREKELRLITNALPVCICYVDADQRYRFVNQTYEDWFSCSRDEILGKHTREILSEAAYQIAKPYISQALAGQITLYEAEIPYPFGKRYISASLIPDFDSGAQVKGYYGLITDISEQREAALRERKRAEAASILEERNRMAREIHDTLAQAFTGILVHMGAVSRLVATNPEAIQTHINTVRDLARSGLAEARRSVAALRPQLLEDGNLWTALEKFVSTMSASTETHLIYEIVGTPYALPSETENNLLRIGQEAFTNAIKYANASEIRIELVYEPTQCFLRIRDNGQGFEVNNTTVSQGFGLLGITERAEYIRAQLSIESQLGQGTEVIVSVHRETAV